MIFCNLEILGLGCHQYQDSVLVKVAGTSRLRFLVFTDVIVNNMQCIVCDLYV